MECVFWNGHLKVQSVDFAFFVFYKFQAFSDRNFFY